MNRADPSKIVSVYRWGLAICLFDNNFNDWKLKNLSPSAFEQIDELKWFQMIMSLLICKKLSKASKA